MGYEMTQQIVVINTRTIWNYNLSLRNLYRFLSMVRVTLTTENFLQKLLVLGIGFTTGYMGTMDLGTHKSNPLLVVNIG